MRSASAETFARLAGKKLMEQLVEAQAWPGERDRAATAGASGR
jgi:hypothetical protein